MNHSRINRWVAGSILLIALVLYLKTMAPTVSFWDCGEFIATSYILGVTHPPGSPLYLLIGRIFSLFPIYEDIGARVNLISALVSAMAVMFVYLSVVHLLRKMRGAPKDTVNIIINSGAAAVAALTFMVTDSHWFNAVEAEVYSMSTFLTAFVIWLILRWSQKDDAGSHTHYILLLAYVFGLATGVHIQNLLALPFIALVVYFRNQEFTWTGFLSTIAFTGGAFLVVYKGVIKGLPQLAQVNILLPGLAIAALIVANIWSIRRRLNTTSVVLTSLTLIVVGYSTYSMVFIRSSQNPAIEVGNPEDVKGIVSYLEREQYGDWSMFDRARWTPATRARYEGVNDFFWNYQIKKMYLRYFLWQFAGRGPAQDPGVSPFGATTVEDGVAWDRYGLPLALLIGLMGMVYHLSRDWKHGLAVLALFLTTGLVLILYLNQPDPQPRERDYSYVGSFLAWSIWIGIGSAGILEYISDRFSDLRSRRIIAATSLVVLLVIMPGVMLAVNYHEHNRSGNYIAWDYSHNLLNSCEEGGILFTNGDNDTFPLWYLQEVDGVRKDVRIVNLSLINTDWYITQMRDGEPKIPLNLSDLDIAQMMPVPWETREVGLSYDNPELGSGTLTWTIRPTYAGRYLRAQDRMIVQIIKDVNFTQPIYFAVTVSPENRIGLEDYLEMQGLVYQLMPRKVKPINIEKLHHNLLEVYNYRGLANPSVYYNNNIRRLMQNVRASFLQLALDGVLIHDYPRAQMYLDTLAATISEEVIPVQNKELYTQMAQLYAEIGDTTSLRQRLDNFPRLFRLRPRDQIRVGAMYGRNLNDWQTADRLLAEAYASNPLDGEIVGSLVQLYRAANQEDKAIPILNDWLAANPSDQNARQILESLK
ncbi:MAG: DUF2723 domain-containing protein [Candidatus Neomarinimicrobiota bacterium]